jgi:hypothetical protein
VARLYRHSDNEGRYSELKEWKKKSPVWPNRNDTRDLETPFLPEG